MIITAKLTERIEILLTEYTTDSIGSPVESTRTIAKVAASITTQRGNNRFSTDVSGFNYEDNISFYLRYRQLDKPKKQYRIKYKEQVYRIINITTVQRNKALVIDCELVK